MTRFEDLPDDCLIEVLDRLSPGQLFKVQRVNKRMKRLAEIKMRTNIKAITWIKDNQLFSRCQDHLGSTSKNQLLFLGKKFKNPYHLRTDPYTLFLNEFLFWKNYQNLDFLESTKTLFLNLLTKCTGIKSFEFIDLKFSGNFLFEVVRRCPELECFKFVDAMVKEKDWSKLLEQIGHKLVHFEVRNYHHFNRRLRQTYKTTMAQVHINLLAMVAAKCSNIKRVDCLVTTDLTQDLLTALKLFPKTCWVSLICQNVSVDVFEDVFDELTVSQSLKWYALGNRNTRLSKLNLSLFSFNYFDFNDPVRRVEFANLKQLEFNGVLRRLKSVNGLLLSRFPRLEELTFNASCRFTEANYNRLFLNMTSVKKFIINYQLDAVNGWALPRSSLKQLKNLEIIVLNVLNIPDDSWNVEGFVTKIEPYVGWISSLKKMTIRVGRMRRVRNTKKVLKEGVERMKQKQKDVEICLTFVQI